MTGILTTAVGRLSGAVLPDVPGSCALGLGPDSVQVEAR